MCGVDSALDRVGEVRRLVGFDAFENDFVTLNELVETNVANRRVARELHASDPAGYGRRVVGFCDRALQPQR